MNTPYRVVLGALLSFLTIGLVAGAGGREWAANDEMTAKIELQLGPEKANVVTVALGQTATEVLHLCKPAKVYADDDPWLGYVAAGGGSYVLMFSAEGTVNEMKGRRDPGRDKLYAVMHYPTESRKDGTILLPATLRDRTCGDIVTLKVTLAPDKAKVATVALGLSTEDVMHLFRASPDDAKKDDGILFDSINEGDRYMLLFSPPNDSSGHDPKRDRLSQVMYWPGGQSAAIFLLPREKRGEPVPAKYRALLENTRSNASPDP
jgi:hypothetical protein